MVSPNAMSGLRHLQSALGAVSHNLANVKTTAYRFQELYSNEVHGNKQQDFGGMGTSTDTTRYANRQGALSQSVSSSDLAITGAGMFVVQQPGSADGIRQPENRYTRDGSFTIDEDGYFTDKNGLKLMFSEGTTAKENAGNLKPLRIAPEEFKYIENIKVDDRGEVVIDFNNDGKELHQMDSKTLGTIPLARFPREENARRIEGGYLLPDKASGNPIVEVASPETATIHQGQLETSTADVTDQLTRMMVIQRGYQANSKALETQDKMLQNMIGNVQ